MEVVKGPGMMIMFEKSRGKRGLGMIMEISGRECLVTSWRAGMGEDTGSIKEVTLADIPTRGQ